MSYFELENHSRVKFNLSKNWQVKKEMFGVPLILLGPKLGGIRRPVITLVSTDISKNLFSEFSKGDGEQAYLSKRKEWLTRYDGKFIKSLGFENSKHDDVDFFTFGYVYQLGGQTLTEKSYYAICNKELFHLKSLVQEGTKEELIDEMKSIVTSFACERKS